MDFDNMSKEQLIEVLKGFYYKLKKPIPDKPKFIVGNYYYIEQTGAYQLRTVAEIDKNFDRNIDDISPYIAYLNFSQADEHFERQLKKE